MQKWDFQNGEMVTSCFWKILPRGTAGRHGSEHLDRTKWHRGPTKYASRCLSRGLSELGFSHLKCIKMLLFSSLWLGLLVFCLSQWFTYLFVPENQVSAHLDNHHHTHPSSVTLRSLLPIETELPCVSENKKEFACRDLGDTLTQCMSERQPCVVIT